MLNQYFKDIYKTYKTGDATEASYYPDLKKLLENFLKSKGISPNITVQSKKTKAGIPDFTIRKGKELIGYVEAKDLTIENLEKVEDSDQIKRYKEKLPNFILTNYFDFWLWRRESLDDKKGRWIKKVRIGQPITLRLKLSSPPQNEKDLFELLQLFFNYYIPERKTAKSLAKELADRANLIPHQIVYLLKDEKAEGINRIYNAFKEYLISDLLEEDFADIYAQTITYGLFAARLRQKNEETFDRFIAERLIPKNIQILYDTFSLISSSALPEAISPYVDDIATILAHADIEKIKKEMHQKRGGDDPLVYFYETFLAEYDPEKRKSRGTYYTPVPVVSYITRSINALLKEKFNKELGFASEGVTILDPAGGTLTFPAQAIRIAKEEVDKSTNSGSWWQIVKNHILKDFYAFEILMAPYIIGHLKISLYLEDLGYKFNLNDPDDHFKLFLTNTLDLSDHKLSKFPFVAELSKQARKAKEIKEKEKILVIMGNPPYSVSSMNKIIEESDYKKLYESYKEKVRKEEKNIQPLSDDYIKFIAFAHWKIKQAGQGIVGMITNNSYLDGLIHRDMRRKLAEDFDEIYILNLHGNLKRKETTPKGGKDENVFDIQQGVGIIILVKKEGLKKKINYFDLYGLREEKYEFLKKYDINNTKWQELELREPNCFFIPKDIKGLELYEKFISLKNIFKKFSSGIKTHRDQFIIGFNNDEIKPKLHTFISDLDDNLVSQFLNLKDTRDWKIKTAREKLKKKGIENSKFFNYLWRPFDIRKIYYSSILIELPRLEVVGQIINGKNLALCVSRKIDKPIWNDILTTNLLADVHSASGQTYVFPLFLYQNNNKNSLFKTTDTRQPNFSSKFYEKIKGTFIEKTEPEEIFNYIYAILYSNIYRRNYNEFLKIDFPKVPFTSDEKLFHKIVEQGKELASLHLLKSQKLEKSVSRFPAVGDNVVRKREYNSKEKRIYINDKQYFDGVEQEVWNYYIGGYQVLDKWLKDRIGRTLSAEDVNHYLKIITALQNTIEIQKEIDKLYPEVEKKIIRNL